MKKIIGSILLSLAFVNAQAATNLNTIISQYKEDVMVHNIAQEEAFVNLVTDIKAQGITTSELLEYVEANSTADEFHNFQTAMSFGAQSLNSLEELNTNDLDLIVTQTLSYTSATGASFRSCAGTSFVGVALLLGGVIMAVQAIDTFQEYEDSDGLFTGKDEELLDEAQRYTVLSVVGLAAGAAVTSSCN